jgi:hypothetical protein
VCLCVWRPTVPVFAQRDLGRPHEVSFWITLSEFQSAYMLFKSDQPLYFDIWDVTQHRLVVSYWCSHLRGSSILVAWLLKLGLICCPGTSVTNYQSILRNIPEERRSRLSCGRSSKLFIVVTTVTWHSGCPGIKSWPSEYYFVVFDGLPQSLSALSG